MGLALPKLGELVQRPPGQGIGGGADGQSDEGLIGVEPGIRASQMLDLHGLDGLDGLPGDEVVLMADPGQALEGVEGVTKADVDLDSKSAVVDLSADVPDKELIDAVTEAGYEAKIA